MTIDRSKMLEDAEEFEKLVSEIMAAFPDMERHTAERVVIHAGHKRLEKLFAAYIAARGENSAQLKGLVDRILKKK